MPPAYGVTILRRMQANRIREFKRFKGIHLVVPRHRINLETGLILRTVDSVLFVIPSANHWIVGTTDSDWYLNRTLQLLIEISLT